MTRPRTKTIPGYRILPGLNPMNRLSFPYLGGEILDADFTRYDDTGDCVEVLMRIGLIPGAYTLLLTIEQALAVDIIEKV